MRWLSSENSRDEVKRRNYFALQKATNKQFSSGCGGSEYEIAEIFAVW